MKTLSDKYSRNDLVSKYHDLNNPWAGYKDGSMKIYNKVSNSNEDLDLLNQVFTKNCFIEQKTVQWIIDNFYGTDIWLFALDGKLLNLWDWTEDWEKDMISLHSEAITCSGLYFAEITLNLSDVVNVLFSNDHFEINPNNKKEIKTDKLDEDLKWLLT